jgi:hypothetical protein
MICSSQVEIDIGSDRVSYNTRSIEDGIICGGEVI